MEPTLKQLHQFYNLSQQAELSSLTISAQQQEFINQLEQQLRCELTAPSVEGLKLTTAGKRLHHYCIELLSQCANLQLTAQRLSQEPRQIRIVVDEVIPTTPILDQLPWLISELPLHQLSLNQLPRSQALKALSCSDADILIRCKQTDKPPRSASRHYGSLPLTLVAAPKHPLCKGRPLTPDHLKLHRQLITPALPKQYIPAVSDSWYIDQPKVLCELAILGAGWALLPHYWVCQALARGQLKELHMHDHSGIHVLELEMLWLQQRREAGFSHCLNLLGALSRD